MKTSVIIPNYMGKEVLQKCLTSLNCVGEDIEVVISDDSSGENIEKTIEDSGLNKPYKIVRRYVNEGFSPAINSGVDVSDGNYLVFLNNDARVEKGWLTYLVQSLETSEDVGAVQSLILKEDGKIDCLGGRVDELGFPHEIGRGERIVEHPVPSVIDYTKAASIIIRRSDTKISTDLMNHFSLVTNQ